MKAKRYEVTEGSRSGHCCFEFSVIDTEDPETLAVCETFTETAARLVCDALNEKLEGENHENGFQTRCADSETGEPRGDAQE